MKKFFIILTISLIFTTLILFSACMLFNMEPEPTETYSHDSENTWSIESYLQGQVTAIAPYDTGRLGGGVIVVDTFNSGSEDHSQMLVFDLGTKEHKNTFGSSDIQGVVRDITIAPSSTRLGGGVIVVDTFNSGTNDEEGQILEFGFASSFEDTPSTVSTINAGTAELGRLSGIRTTRGQASKADVDNLVLVVDSDNNKIEIIDVTTQEVYLTWESGVINIDYQGSTYSLTVPDEYHFNAPEGIALSPNFNFDPNALNGYVYIVDSGNNRVVRININLATVGVAVSQSSTELMMKVIGDGEGSENAKFKSPKGIDNDADGNIYVADSGNHRIQKFDEDGEFLSAFGTYGSGDGQLDTPTDVTVVGSTVFVTDSGNDRVVAFSLDQ